MAKKNRIQEKLGIAWPLVQAPMAGCDSIELAVAVAEAGGLGSLACTLLGVDQVRQAWKSLREKTAKPINLNFFCHSTPTPQPEKEKAWQIALQKYAAELGVTEGGAPTPRRSPFNEEFCDLLEELRVPIVSFHFGLPEDKLIERLRRAGTAILASATTVREAKWLVEHGCDVVIAQGYEAGGHSGMFLDSDLGRRVGTMALVPQIVDAVKVPVIAAGGIADARGIVAARALGAEAVQLGTAYLFCPEAKVAKLYREALLKAGDDGTVLTNVFSGRPARGIRNRFVQEMGPISPLAPDFPLAGDAVGPLRKASEAKGSTDFMQMWSGQAASLSRALPAGELTRRLIEEASRLGGL